MVGEVTLMDTLSPFKRNNRYKVWRLFRALGMTPAELQQVFPEASQWWKRSRYHGQYEVIDSPEIAALLDKLVTIERQISNVFQCDYNIELWMRSPQRVLNNQRPIDLVLLGELEEVSTALSTIT